MRAAIFAALPALLLILLPSQAKTYEPTPDQMDASLVHAYWLCKSMIGDAKSDNFSDRNRNLRELGLLDDWKKIPADEVHDMFDFWLVELGGLDKKRTSHNLQSLRSETERACWQLVRTRSNWFNN